MINISYCSGSAADTVRHPFTSKKRKTNKKKTISALKAEHSWPSHSEARQRRRSPATDGDPLTSSSGDSQRRAKRACQIQQLCCGHGDAERRKCLDFLGKQLPKKEKKKTAHLLFFLIDGQAKQPGMSERLRVHEKPMPSLKQTRKTFSSYLAIEDVLWDG